MITLGFRLMMGIALENSGTPVFRDLMYLIYLFRVKDPYLPTNSPRYLNMSKFTMKPTRRRTKGVRRSYSRSQGTLRPEFLTAGASGHGAISGKAHDWRWMD